MADFSNNNLTNITAQAFNTAYTQGINLIQRNRELSQQQANLDRNFQFDMTKWDTGQKARELAMQSQELELGRARLAIADTSEAGKLLGSPEYTEPLQSGDPDAIYNSAQQLAPKLSTLGARNAFLTAAAADANTAKLTKVSREAEALQQNHVTQGIQEFNEAHKNNWVDPSITAQDYLSNQTIQDDAAFHRVRNFVEDWNKDNPAAPKSVTDFYLDPDPSTGRSRVDTAKLNAFQSDLAENTKLSMAERLKQAEAKGTLGAKQTEVAIVQALVEAGQLTSEQGDQRLAPLGVKLPAGGFSVPREVASEAKQLRETILSPKDIPFETRQAARKAYDEKVKAYPGVFTPISEADPEVGSAVKRLTAIVRDYTGKSGSDWHDVPLTDVDADAKAVIPDLEAAFADSGMSQAEINKKIETFKGDRGMRSRIAGEAKALLSPKLFNSTSPTLFQNGEPSDKVAPLPKGKKFAPGTLGDLISRGEARAMSDGTIQRKVGGVWRQLQQKNAPAAQ